MRPSALLNKVGYVISDLTIWLMKVCYIYGLIAITWHLLAPNAYCWLSKGKIVSTCAYVIGFACAALLNEWTEERLEKTLRG